MAAGMVFLSFGKQRVDAVYHLNDVGAGLPLNIYDHGGRFIAPGSELFVFDAVHYVGDIFELDGAIVLIGDHYVFVVFGG